MRIFCFKSWEEFNLWKLRSEYLRSYEKKIYIRQDGGFYRYETVQKVNSLLIDRYPIQRYVTRQRILASTTKKWK